MTYQETIDFLFAQVPMYQKYGASAIKMDLSNIEKLVAHLDSPHESWPSIHIAGTNGKGTVTHMIASILQEHGYQVGVYTSPHYVDFRERIKINGELIDENYVVDFVQNHQDHIQQSEYSFFELSVGMAFRYFADREVDIAIIETGLGGRLDSTNILNPLVSVITHISMDHMNLLGDTIELIAAEKAGIIKSKKPVVIGRYQASCDRVFYEKAKSCYAPLSFASVEWVHNNGVMYQRHDSENFLSVSTESESPFYIENVKTAVTAVYAQSMYSISRSSIEKGIKNYRNNTNYIGRWMSRDIDGVRIIADSAHNEDAVKKVLSRLQNEKYLNLHMVIGFVGDKDHDKILAMMPRDADYYFVQPSIFRALAAKDLAEKANSYDLYGAYFIDVAEGYKKALEQAQSGDLIYIGGSSFVVGDYLANI